MGGGSFSSVEDIADHLGFSPKRAAQVGEKCERLFANFLSSSDILLIIGPGTRAREVQVDRPIASQAPDAGRFVVRRAQAQGRVGGDIRSSICNRDLKNVPRGTGSRVSQKRRFVL